MRKDQPISYFLMVGLTLIFTILAVLTLWPNPAASKPNIFGYRSLCPFAPAATAVCCLLAGLCCTLRNRFVSNSAAANRRGPWFAPITVVIVFGAITLFSGFRYASLQSEFTGLIASLATNAATPAALADGMRQAEMTVGPISVKVRVKVAAGTIIGVELLSGKNLETSLATSLGQQVIDRQTTAVDVVAGATASSEVFLKTVQTALYP